jgi:hypothetical protein
MEQPDYEKTWIMLVKERNTLLSQRTSLENELSEIGTKLRHVNEVLMHLAPLAGMPDGDNIAGLGITDAIRQILKGTEERLSPIEVRDSLLEKGFDLSGLSAPMASIYKILSRLADVGNPEIFREREDDGKVFYRWIRTDDDIPF